MDPFPLFGHCSAIVQHVSPPSFATSVKDPPCIGCPLFIRLTSAVVLLPLTMLHRFCSLPSKDLAFQRPDRPFTLPYADLFF